MFRETPVCLLFCGRKKAVSWRPKKKNGIKIKLMKPSVMAFSKKIVFCAYTAFEYLYWPKHCWYRAWSKLIYVKRSFSLLQTEIKLSSSSKIWVIVYFRVRHSLTFYHVKGIWCYTPDLKSFQRSSSNKKWQNTEEGKRRENVCLGTS